LEENVLMNMRVERKKGEFLWKIKRAEWINWEKKKIG